MRPLFCAASGRGSSASNEASNREEGQGDARAQPLPTLRRHGEEHGPLPVMKPPPPRRAHVAIHAAVMKP